MKNILLLASLVQVAAFAQTPDRVIKEKDVKKIIQTLAADDMRGRSASDEKAIFKAAAFIEKEFEKIGLTHLPGLATYLQPFQKQRISTDKIEVTIDGKKINRPDIVLASEKKNISIKGNLTVKTITPDTSSNKQQYFFDKAFALYRDTSSYLVLVDTAFRKSFNEFKGYLNRNFARGRTFTKVFVLGETKAETYSVTASQKIENINMANVVGVIEGKSKKDEMVVFSGHYDHIGIQKFKVKGDSIANGADDDASGTTAVIELAKYFKKIKTNERTLIFVAFTAEEIGGYGSRYFSEHLNADKVTAMFNIEMIGKPSKWGQNHLFITGFERSDFGTILQKNLAGSGYELHPDPYPAQNLFYRSDNATLARLGVPAHSLSTDQIDSDHFYHTVDDEIETIDITNLTNTIRAIAIGAKSIVEGQATPTRIDKATVK